MRIQFIIDGFISEDVYAADDATEARIWDDEHCLAELKHTGSDWEVTWIEPFFYAEHADHFIGEHYDSVNGLVSDLEALENAV